METKQQSKGREEEDPSPKREKRADNEESQLIPQPQIARFQYQQFAPGQQHASSMLSHYPPSMGGQGSSMAGTPGQNFPSSSSLQQFNSNPHMITMVPPGLIPPSSSLQRPGYQQYSTNSGSFAPLQMSGQGSGTSQYMYPPIQMMQSLQGAMHDPRYPPNYMMSQGQYMMPPYMNQNMSHMQSNLMTNPMSNPISTHQPQYAVSQPPVSIEKPRENKKRIDAEAKPKNSSSSSTAQRRKSPELSKDEDTVVKTKRQRRKPLGGEYDLNGESRLAITFLNLGEAKPNPETLGWRSLAIPDGLSGTFIMYGENWRFLIEYGQAITCPDGLVRRRLEWSICNQCAPDFKALVIENDAEVMRRSSRGVTVCNRVFRIALEARAKFYEAEVEQERAQASPNDLKIKQLMSRIHILRPERFAEGPLLFGLRHGVVQEIFLEARKN
jgi:hypothetical protein